MSDHQPHTPTTDHMRDLYVRHADQLGIASDHVLHSEFDRFLAAAEQRGAVRHLREVASELNMHHLTEDLSDSALKLGVRFVNLIQDRADRVEGTTSDDND